MESGASESNRARILRYLADELDAEETAAFEAWLKADPSHQAEFERVRIDWSPEADSVSDAGPDADLEWARMMRWTTPTSESPAEPAPSLDSTSSPDPPRRDVSEREPDPPAESSRVSLRFRPEELHPWLSYAFVGVVALVGLWLIVVGFGVVFRGGANDGAGEVTAEAGEVRMLVLPDSSVVRLNSESVVRYPPVFSEQTRRVTLSGEAFFEVKPDDRPFFVDTDGAELRSRKGTFNVWARNRETRVVAREGSVRLWDRMRPPGETVVLAPDEGATARTGRPTERMDVEYVPAALDWLDGMLIFHETAFDEAVAEIERAYATSIRVEAPELHRLTVTDTLNTTEIDTALARFCRSLTCRVQSDAGGYVLTQ